MPSHDHQRLSSPLVDWLIKYMARDGLSHLFDLLLTMRRYLCRQPNGSYELLDYEATVELLDTKGKQARFKKRQRVKFLQNSVIAFEDYAWGDGDVLTGYQCSPGVVVDKYREGDRWNILVSLRSTKSIGDVEQFHIEQDVHNTYLKRNEWLQTEIRRHTRHLKMNVIFPKARHCQHAVLARRHANRSEALGPEHFDILPDGRQLLTWETDHVRAYELYTLKWRW